MNESDLAYLAGFFDGEGSVSISENGKPSPRALSPNHTLQVAIGNTDITVLKQIQQHFGGYLTTRCPSKPRHKTVYQWSLRSTGAADFLKAIRPYLKMKCKQADIAIAFQESKPKYSKARVTAEIVAWREQQRKDIRMLNGRHIDGGTVSPN